MAFDSTNPTDLATLKALVPNPDLGTQIILDGLNNPSEAAGAETGIPALTARALLDIILELNIASGDQFKLQLLFEATSGLESNLTEFRLKIMDLSPAISSGVNALRRSLSIAELSFSNIDENGINEIVTITDQDWALARES